MNFTSWCDQGISGFVEQHHGGNCGASIVKFLKSRKLHARVHLHVYARAYPIYSKKEKERERERESWFYVSRFNMEGIVIPRMQWRLSDELACVSTTKTSFDDPPAFIPASLTASMLFLANFWLHNFPLNAKIAWMRSCQDMYKIAWW